MGIFHCKRGGKTDQKNIVLKMAPHAAGKLCRNRERVVSSLRGMRVLGDEGIGGHQE